MKSDTIRGHRLNNIYNPIFELTLTPEQIAMIDEVCKPFISQNNKSDIDDAVLYVSTLIGNPHIANLLLTFRALNVFISIISPCLYNNCF